MPPTHAHLRSHPLTPASEIHLTHYITHSHSHINRLGFDASMSETQREIELFDLMFCPCLFTNSGDVATSIMTQQNHNHSHSHSQNLNQNANRNSPNRSNHNHSHSDNHKGDTKREVHEVEDDEDEEEEDYINARASSSGGAVAAHPQQPLHNHNTKTTNSTTTNSNSSSGSIRHYPHPQMTQSIRRYLIIDCRPDSQERMRCFIEVTNPLNTPIEVLLSAYQINTSLHTGPMHSINPPHHCPISIHFTSFINPSTLFHLCASCHCCPQGSLIIRPDIVEEVRKAALSRRKSPSHEPDLGDLCYLSKHPILLFNTHYQHTRTPTPSSNTPTPPPLLIHTFIRLSHSHCCGDPCITMVVSRR